MFSVMNGVLPSLFKNYLRSEWHCATFEAILSSIIPSSHSILLFANTTAHSPATKHHGQCVNSTELPEDALHYEEAPEAASLANTPKSKEP